MKPGSSSRSDFPFFQNNPGVTFLDSAASSLTPYQVARAVQEYYEKLSVNIHRGVYAASAEATAVYESTRSLVKDFIDAPDMDIVYTRNATEGFNLAATSLSQAGDRLGSINRLFAWETPLRKDDVIVISESEHHANIVPWHFLRERLGVRIEFIPVHQNGVLDVDFLKELKAQCSGRIKIVSLSQLSNVTGVAHNLAPFREFAREQGAVFIVDAAQSVCHAPLSAQKLDADFILFSAHKMLGPTGIGICAARKDILEILPPYQGGGDMILSVAKDEILYADSPQKFEAGTPHIAGVFGLRAAIEYLRKTGLSSIHEWEQKLTFQAMEFLVKEGVELHGPSLQEVEKGEVEKAGVLSFSIAGIHPHDMATIFDKHGVAIRAGHHCCQVLMRKWGLTATSRASFYLYNDSDDVERLLEAVKAAKKLFQV